MLVCEFSESHRFLLGMETLTLRDNLSPRILQQVLYIVFLNIVIEHHLTVTETGYNEAIEMEERGCSTERTGAPT